MDRKGFYAVLEISERAGEKEIKAAFRRQVKLYHPDKNSDPEAQAIYLKINEAYHVLTDPEARRAYDSDSSGGADFIPCSCCGRHPRQPRFILFDEDGVLKGGVYCRPCASKQQFLSAVKNWTVLFKNPLRTWRALHNNYRLNGMPDNRNFEILMQNAAAFRHEKRTALARSLAEQARKFAKEPDERLRINTFLSALPETPGIRERNFWIIGWPDALRVYLPVFMAAIVGLVVLTTPYLRSILHSGPSRIVDYKPQEVMPVAFDPSNMSQLFHTTAKQTPAYQAPCSDCGIIAQLPEQTTVRITGIVPDYAWVQVMTPDGTVVFVRTKSLEKGIGKAPMPYNSKILPPKR